MEGAARCDRASHEQRAFSASRAIDAAEEPIGLEHAWDSDARVPNVTAIVNRE
jgi:hypothetical protein